MTPEELVGMAMDAGNEGMSVHELPVGAVVMLGDEVVGRAHSQERTHGRRLAHAELLAMQQADRLLGRTPRGAPLTLATNLEPCLMCLGAASMLGVESVYYGLEDPNNGAAGITGEHRPVDASQLPQVIGGIRRLDCRAQFTRFAAATRRSASWRWASALADRPD